MSAPPDRDDDPGPVPGSGAGPPPAPRRALALTVLFDVLLPAGSYYALRAAGLSELVALLLSGTAPALHTAHTMIRHRRVDMIGLFVVALLLLGAAGSLISGSPRLALARNGWFTALAAAWMLCTLATRRPFTYRALEALLPGRAAHLDRLWRTEPRFRGVWRGLTWLWGVGLLVDAALRVLMAYTLPVDSVPALDGALYVATYVLLQVITHVALHRTGTLRMVFAEGPAAGAAGEAPDTGSPAAPGAPGAQPSTAERTMTARPPNGSTR